LNYIQVTFKRATLSEQDMEILIAMLNDAGYEGFLEERDLLRAYIGKDDYNENILQGILTSIPDIFSAITYTSDSLPNINWNATWESSYAPVFIKNKVYIRAPFHKPFSKAEFDLVIQPQMSFGTGHHATTQLMVSAVLDAEVQHKAVLDMGCGTGILAILACKIGAANVHAIDIEEGAYKNTIENAERNEVSSCMHPEKGDASLLKKEVYDIIFANINRIILIKDMFHYADALKYNGCLIMSGFIKQDEKLLKHAVKKNNLTVIDTVYEDEWVRITCKKQ